MLCSRLALLLFALIAVIGSSLQAQQLPDILPANPSVSAKDIRAHVEWFSSDALEGRGTGSTAIDRAAEYLVREFTRFGLAPAGERGYLQTFEVVTGASRGACSLTLAKDGDAVLVDSLEFIPFTFSGGEAFSGRPVFARYGIVDASVLRNDYDGIDAKGGVVIVLHGMPRNADPHGSSPLLATARSKALAAREAGAVALLIVHDDPVASREFRYDGSSSGAGIPVARISRAAAKSMLAAADIDTSELESGASAQAANQSVRIDGVFDVRTVRARTSNVAAFLPGRDDARKNEVVVIGAHYDHLGWGQEGSLYRGAEPLIHNGADDNASGTAGIIELAEYFTAHRPERSLLFIAFSGEEMGLLGSMHWVSHPTIPLSRITAMVNLDMIGRLVDSTRRLNVQGIGTSPAWKSIVTSKNEAYEFDLALIEDGQGASDHSSFYGKGIPVLFFFTGLHTDYHRPSDDADKINYDGQEKVVRYIADVVNAIDAQDSLAFTRVVQKEDQKVSRFNVYVGTIPDYANTGEGFRITGTSPGSPADKAGMKEGDIILRFGETDVKSIYDYMAALGRHTPGEIVTVIVKRGGESLALQVELVSK